MDTPDDAPADLSPDRHAATMYDAACDYVRGRTSVAPKDLKRDLAITLTVAGLWLERMEADGLVGAANDIKRRVVLRPAGGDQTNDILPVAAKGRLTTIVERIERLNEDRDIILADIKEVYSEAKGEGFDVKILRLVVKRRKLEPAALAEAEALLELYEAAIAETQH